MQGCLSFKVSIELGMPLLSGMREACRELTWKGSHCRDRSGVLLAFLTSPCPSKC